MQNAKHLLFNDLKHLVCSSCLEVNKKNGLFTYLAW